MASEEMIMKRLDELQLTLQNTVENAKNDLMKEITSRVSKLERETKEEFNTLNTIIEHLQQRIHGLEQHTRKPEVIVVGIAEREDEEEEDLISEIIEVAGKLQVKLGEKEISGIHRLPTRIKSTARPVIVRLTSYRMKTMLVKKSKEIRLNGIYINEHMTQKSREILAAARELRDGGYIKFAWFRDGKVLIREDERGRAILVSGLEELNAIKLKMDQMEVQIGQVGENQSVNREPEGRRNMTTVGKKTQPHRNTKKIQPQTLDRFIAAPNTRSRK